MYFLDQVVKLEDCHGQIVDMKRLIRSEAGRHLSNDLQYILGRHIELRVLVLDSSNTLCTLLQDPVLLAARQEHAVQANLHVLGQLYGAAVQSRLISRTTRRASFRPLCPSLLTATLCDLKATYVPVRVHVGYNPVPQSRYPRLGPTASRPFHGTIPTSSGAIARRSPRSTTSSPGSAPSQGSRSSRCFLRPFRWALHDNCCGFGGAGSFLAAIHMETYGPPLANGLLDRLA
ncbi:hypothetical protein BCR44DRAFT_311277 [Catenaria anguillulae PL171]|uniref:Uncharacterized protein n=1 Tax=Catenaria anguillulae PL171 TaxID=765915 RepID=A0A1Y2HYU7_9FUNG|nr:hypothetical protein BCR44DRAFT_311277 [Catenaria anguillulae PL171]